MSASIKPVAVLRDCSADDLVCVWKQVRLLTYSKRTIKPTKPSSPFYFFSQNPCECPSTLEKTGVPTYPYDMTKGKLEYILEFHLSVLGSQF